MRILFIILFIVAVCTAFELKMTPRVVQPCKGKMCYEKYLEKMKGFINGTQAAP
jgi:hypothetical protein